VKRLDHIDQIRRSRNAWKQHLLDVNRRRKLGRRASVKRHRILVPKKLNLDAEYQVTTAFLEDIRASCLVRHEFVLLDFSECEEVSSAAIIVLAAEIDRCRRLVSHLGRPRLTGNYPKSDDVYLALKDIGFFKLLGIADIRVGLPTLNSDRAFMIALRTGTRTKGEWVEAICEEVFDDVALLSRDGLGLVYRGITEAMNNVTDHAYSISGTSAYPVLYGQWWVAGYRNRATQTVIYLMFDQGVGIPATLPITHASLISAIKSRLGIGTTDKDLIAAAMAIGATSTGESQRGYGLMDLRQLIEDSVRGEMTILSGRGAYRYSKDEGGATEAGWDLPVSLGGTLVHWEISQSNEILWNSTDVEND
jgi:hypothetical protein